MTRAAKTLTPLLLVMLLGACAGTYEPPPASQPRARMRIVQHPFTDNTRMQIMELPNNCVPATLDPTYDKFNIVAILPGRGNMSPGLRGEIGMPNPPNEKASFSEVYVPSGKPFRYASYFESDFRIRSFKGCFVAVSFVPEAGADYETRIELTPEGCRHAVRRLGADGVGDTAVQIERMTQRCTR